MDKKHKETVHKRGNPKLVNINKHSVLLIKIKQLAKIVSYDCQHVGKKENSYNFC